MSTLKKWFSSRSLTGVTFLILGALVAFMPESALAAANQSWGDVAASGGETLNAFKTLVVIAAYLLGTGLFFLGLWLIYKDGKEENRGHMKNGIIAMIVGSLLLIFPTTVGWTVGTLGADDTALDEDFSTDF